MHAFVLDRKRECTSRRNEKEKQSHLKEWHCRRPTLMNVRSCLKSPFFRERRSSISNADDPSRCRDVFPSSQTSGYRRSKRTYACSQQTRNLICLWCNTHVTQEIKFRSIRLRTREKCVLLCFYRIGLVCSRDHFDYSEKKKDSRASNGGVLVIAVLYFLRAPSTRSRVGRSNELCSCLSPSRKKHDLQFDALALLRKQELNEISSICKEAFEGTRIYSEHHVNSITLERMAKYGIIARRSDKTGLM